MPNQIIRILLPLNLVKVSAQNVVLFEESDSLLCPRDALFQFQPASIDLTSNEGIFTTSRKLATRLESVGGKFGSTAVSFKCICCCISLYKYWAAWGWNLSLQISKALFQSNLQFGRNCFTLYTDFRWIKHLVTSIDHSAIFKHL